MQLYSYYRSTAAYRIRIALQYKKLNYECIPVNLLKGQHHDENYVIYNPQRRVPTLIDNGFVLGQSMAILEYLEEQYPTPTILPGDPQERAWVRSIAQIIACDIHPLNNLGVLKYLGDKLHHSKEEITSWYHHWLKQGFDPIENLLQQNSAREHYCLGNTPTFADICLVPQVYNAHRFEFSMNDYPIIREINDYCLTQPFFEQARPENQPDYVV